MMIHVIHIIEIVLVLVVLAAILSCHAYFTAVTLDNDFLRQTRCKDEKTFKRNLVSCPKGMNHSREELTE